MRAQKNPEVPTVRAAKLRKLEEVEDRKKNFDFSFTVCELIFPHITL